MAKYTRLLSQQVAAYASEINRLKAFAGYETAAPLRLSKHNVRNWSVVQAPAPSKPIARSYTVAGLLAHIVTGKYADHLPLYRQSEIYRRQDVRLNSATPERRTGAVAELLEPLYGVLRQLHRNKSWCGMFFCSLNHLCDAFVVSGRAMNQSLRQARS